jgi:hypothetical protein
MHAPLDRDAFLALVQVKSTTLAQRQHVGEQALAFGLSKPAHINEYYYLDGAASILASMMNRAGIDLMVAAGIVRQRWDDWLTLLIRVEHFHVEQFVCVAWPSADRSTPPHIVMGDEDHINNVCPRSEHALYLISMSFLLRCLRGNAAKAGIQLPERLTVDPERDKPAYDRWRTEIDLLREAAGMRVAKIKPLTPA